MRSEGRMWKLVQYDTTERNVILISNSEGCNTTQTENNKLPLGCSADKCQYCHCDHKKKKVFYRYVIKKFSLKIVWYKETMVWFRKK
jgi:hypothetical protein